MLDSGNEWFRLGPAGFQNAKDVRDLFDRCREQLDPDKFDSRNPVDEMDRLRNFLASGIQEELSKLEKEEKILNRKSENLEYFGMIASKSSEFRQLLENESVRINNAIRQAEQRVDRGENPSKVFEQFLQIEEQEESNIEEAESLVKSIEEIVEEHSLEIPYKIEKFKRKLLRKEHEMIASVE